MLAPTKTETVESSLIQGTSGLIYLDNNATTMIDARVASHIADLLGLRMANPSSQHAAGRRARQVLEGARDEILVQCGARTQGFKSDQLLFTSGGTESNNLAVFGLAANRPGCVIVSSIEHPSVLGAAQHLERNGRTVHYLHCDPTGVVNLGMFEELLAQTTEPIACVSLMLANNETGVLQPIARAASICRSHGIPIHCDAVQGLGKINVHFEQLGLDAMTITAHKLHGPVGVGALILRHGMTISPQLFGGFQQLGLRPGTEAPALAGGFARAVTLAVSEHSSRSQRMDQMRHALESRILTEIPSAIVIGANAPRLPHTSCMAFPGLDRQALHLALDQAGIACSTGSACASGSSQPSHVLEAMGLPKPLVRGAIRFSLSFETTSDEIDQAVDRIVMVVQRLSHAAGRAQVP